MYTMILPKAGKQQYQRVNNERGVAALLTIVIIAAATLIMAFNSSLLGLGELELGYNSGKAGEALSIAEGCAEQAVRQSRSYPSYTGGTLNFDTGSCIITVTQGGNDRTIVVTGTVDDYNKKIEVQVTLSDSNTTISSWEELDN
jgi:hypothetical protein